MRISVFLMLLLGAPLAFADSVSDFVRGEMRAQKVPGLSIAVCRDGAPIRLEGYGECNIEHHVKALPDTVYQSASVGKQFTATLTAMLAHDGSLSLEDPISRWFPEQATRWKGVRVRHLLSHTSGMPDMPYDEMNLRKDYSESELVKLIARNELQEAPGAKWRYNNAGYVLLGILIHRATGKFYGDLLRERIFVPLGMDTARVISERDIVPNRAAGYEMTSRGIKNQAWVSPGLNTTADGSLYLSVRDFAKWDEGLNGETLLPKKELERLWTPAKLNNGSYAGGTRFGYGYGWEIAKEGSHRLAQHDGAWQGFRTFIVRLLDRRLTVVVLANLDTADPQKIATGILRLYLQTSAAGVQPSSAVESSLGEPNQRRRRAGGGPSHADPAAVIGRPEERYL